MELVTHQHFIQTKENLTESTLTLKKCHLAVIGQSANLAPADKKLYALRDVTATVDSILNVLLNKEIKDGSIIIGHSTKEDCVVPDALAIALPILYEQGYRFCTLSQLFELQGIDYEDIPTGKYIKGVTVTDGVVEYRY